MDFPVPVGLSSIIIGALLFFSFFFDVLWRPLVEFWTLLSPPLLLLFLTSSAVVPLLVSYVFFSSLHSFRESNIASINSRWTIYGDSNGNGTVDDVGKGVVPLVSVVIVIKFNYMHAVWISFTAERRFQIEARGRGHRVTVTFFLFSPLSSGNAKKCNNLLPVLVYHSYLHRFIFQLWHYYWLESQTHASTFHKHIFFIASTLSSISCSQKPLCLFLFSAQFSFTFTLYSLAPSHIISTPRHHLETTWAAYITLRQSIIAKCNHLLHVVANIILR